MKCIALLRTTVIATALLLTAPTFAQFGWSDTITLESGENMLPSAVIDPDGEFAYFGTFTSPGQVVKIDLSTSERIDAITLEEGENNLRSAVVSPDGAFAYFGTGTSPAHVVKVDLETFERVDVVPLQGGENNLQSAVISPDGESAYFGTYTNPGRVVKIDLVNFEREGVVTLEGDSSGESYLGAVAITPDGAFVYFGSGTSPGRIIKVGTDPFERTEAITLDEQSLRSAAIAPDGAFAYFGTSTSPSRVVKINLDSFEQVDAVELDEGENSLNVALIDPNGDFLYGGTGTSPGRVVKVSLDPFERVDGITLPNDENNLYSAAIDPSGAFGYFGTFTSPGEVVKVQLRELQPIAEISPSSFAFEVPAEGNDTGALTISNIGNADLDWSIEEAESAFGVQNWADDFDNYEAGSQIHGQGGWKGWENDPAFGALVSDAESNSASHSVEIVGDSDLIHEFEGIDSGQWTFTAWQFVPTDFNGQTYFILLNGYDDSGTGLNWSTQVMFDSDAGEVINEGNSGGSLPMITGEWVELRVELDLDEDTQDLYYNDELLYSGTWTEEVSGGGALNVAAIDLFANGASAVHYDDVSVAESGLGSCDAPSDVAWLSVTPDEGTTAPESSEEVEVMVDASTVNPDDEYVALLCATTNDPGAGLVEIPVTMTVGGIGTEATPGELAEVLSTPSPNPVSTAATFTLAVENGQNVAVEVFDLMGRRIQTLYDGALAAEMSEPLTLDASELPAGVYVIRAAGEDFTKTRRVTVVR